MILINLFGRLAKRRAARALNPEKYRAAAKRLRAANLEGARTRERAWRAAHPEVFREASRKYAAANPDKVRANRKKWDAANPERRRELKRISAAANYENGRARFLRWRAANVERYRETQRQWRLANHVRVLEYLRRYRCNASRAGGVVTAKQINDRVKFFGGVCSYCGGPYEHLDHAIPLSRGGTNWPANLRPACQHCNLSKGAKSAMEFIQWRRAT
jgi:5-methylcytosine-specific restriction endonuclease McrA